jgi:hypothetical protein
MEEKFIRVVFQTPEKVFDSEIDDFSDGNLSKVYSMAMVSFGNLKDEIVDNGGYVLVESDSSGRPTNLSIRYDDAF